MKKTLSLLISSTMLFMANPVFAADEHHDGHMAQDAQHQDDKHHSAEHDADMWASGTVKKVDVEKSLIKIKHGPIKNMNMPPMTMSFGVVDKGLLSQVKVGDEILFKVEKMDGKMVLTKAKMNK